MAIRTRIALFGAGVVALAVFLFGLLLYGLVAYGLHVQRDRALILRGDQAVAALRLAGPVTFQRSATVTAADLTRTSDGFVELLDASGTPITSSGVIDGSPPPVDRSVLRQATSNGAALATIRPLPALPLRVYVRPWSRPDLGRSGYLVAGQPDRAIQALLRGLRLFLFLAALLSLIGALVALWIVSGRSLRPLELMAGTADAIGQTEDLGRRLPEAPARDEIGILTRSFNRMLGRLQESQARLAGALEAQKRFVADASHELRTPLTTIRNNAAFLLRQPDSNPEDRQAALEDIAAESERMSRLVHDLLTLARADAGQHLDLSRVDLSATVADVCRQAATLYGGQRVELMEAGPLPVWGNEDALRELSWILLDNAVKHAPGSSTIRVALERHDGVGALTVADDGPGIPEGQLERIFDRFVQADAARGGGAGLGLAIAGWIAREHGGRISAGNHAPHGAVFTVTLPLDSSSDS